MLAGRVLVVRESPSQSQMLHTENAGGVLGEIPVFGGGRFPATAHAIEPTRCAHLGIGVIERLLLGGADVCPLRSAPNGDTSTEPTSPNRRADDHHGDI